MIKAVRKILCSLIGVAALFLWAGPVCAQKAAQTGGNDKVKLRLTKLDGTVVEKWVEKPRYGGTFVQGEPAAPVYFDEVFGYQGQAWTLHLTHNDLITGNWAMGPEGTGEASFLYVLHPSLDLLAGSIAESWEFPDGETIVWHIRKGVHFHNKPPVNGREMTAEDVVFSLKRQSETKGAYIAAAYGKYIKSITAPDAWTVVVKCEPDRFERVFRNLTYMVKIVPREVMEKHGDMNDWENAVGTGPFILTNYVTNSAITFERNPNYWCKDPLHPDNRLPYLDGLKIIIIPDIATRLAALRTKKLDWLGGYNGAITWEDGKSLVQTTPGLEHLEFYQGRAAALFMRTDKKPFDDVRVRRALAMAINNKEIADTYFGGTGRILSFPVGPIAEFMDIYRPVEELPQVVREQFEYHPEKAKQLLTEAGYPNGFKTQVLCLQEHVDLLSITEAYWAAIGVQLDINVKERAVHTSLGSAKTYDQMYMSGVVAYQPEVMTVLQRDNLQNWSMINDETFNEAHKQIMAAWLNPREQHRLIRELVPHILEQAYFIQYPGGTQFTVWWPWVRGYQGEAMVGLMNNHDFPHYIWLDQELKKKVAGGK